MEIEHPIWLDELLEQRNHFGSECRLQKGSKDLRTRIFRNYSKMAARSRCGPYNLDFLGLDLAVLPTVYAPDFFTDSEWFATHLPQIVRDKKVLEIGTGTGAVAIVTALHGAEVVATDVNPHAVANARINFARYNLRASVSLGDVFDAITPDDKFDFIFWLHPFNNWPRPVQSLLLRSGLDYNYNSLTRYIKGGRKHLRSNGRLLLGTADTADIRAINTIANLNGYIVQVLCYDRTTFDKGTGSKEIAYLMCELVPMTATYKFYCHAVGREWGIGQHAK